MGINVAIFGLPSRMIDVDASSSEMVRYDRSAAVSGLIRPDARRCFFWLAALCGGLLVIAWTWRDITGLVWGSMIAFAGILCIDLFSRYRRRYYSPLVISLFFLFGYVLSTADLVLYYDMKTPFPSRASLLWSRLLPQHFVTIMVVIACGIAGLFIATVIAEKSYRHLMKPRLLNWRRISVSPRTIVAFSIVWSMGSLLLILVMWHLGIGRTGLEPDRSLPYGMTGMAIYARNILVPLGGCFILQLALRAERRRMVTACFGLLVLLGAIGSFTSMSRGFFVNMILPEMLYVYITERPRWWHGRRMAVLAFLVIAFFVVSVSVVMSLRNVGYVTGKLSVRRVLASMSVDDFKQGALIGSSLLVDRMLGMEELVPVCALDNEQSYNPWAVFLGDGDEVRRVNSGVLGTKWAKLKGLSFGAAYGIWGMLFLSRSYVVLFIGTVLFLLHLLFLEHLLLVRGLPLVALGVVINVGMWVWGGAQLAYLLRASFMVVVFCVATDAVLDFNRVHRQMHLA